MDSNRNQNRNQNQSRNLNQNRTPNFRQPQYDRYRRELTLYDDYCRSQQQYGCAVEIPQFNRFGQITNMPPNLRRTHFPSVTVIPPNQFYLPGMEQTNYQLPPYNANSFALSYTLSQDRNSPGQLFFEEFGNHPSLPSNMTPTKVVFVYERSGTPIVVPPQNVIHHVHHINRQPAVIPTKPATVDSGTGDFSVVRYNQETQTECRCEEHRQVADNQLAMHNAIMQRSAARALSVTSNLSQPESPEFNEAVMKVGKWLQLTQSIVTGSNQPPQELPAPTLAPARNAAYHQMKTMPAPFVYTPPPPPPQILRKIPFHGSQVVGNFKKQAAVQSKNLRHSTDATTNTTTERERDVDDKKEKAIVVVLRDSEKPDEGNNAGLLADESVADEISSVSNEVEADINTALSHGEAAAATEAVADESQKDSTGNTESDEDTDDTDDGDDDDASE